MALYEYEHLGKACSLGKVFELEQSIKDDALKVCPKCRGKVKRLIGAPGFMIPKSDSELKSQGFSKLVRRDDGVYENVTAREGESRVVKVGDHSTYPDFKPKKKR